MNCTYFSSPIGGSENEAHSLSDKRGVPPMSYRFLEHRMTGFVDCEDEQYWKSLEDGELRLPRCLGCGCWRWESIRGILGTPIPRCGECGSWEMNWVQVAMVGTIYAWVRTNQPFDGVRERTSQVPYVTVEVELDGRAGPRVLGVLQGSEMELRVGAPVTGSIDPPSEASKWHAGLRWTINTTTSDDGATANETP